jgi:anti-sigma B factor antagonist
MAVRVSAQGTSRATHLPRPRFAAAIAQLGNGTPVVSVMGELDLAAVPGFERTLQAVTEAATGEVIVDLSRCSFLDSNGLRVLVATGQRLERSSRSLALVAAGPIVMRIFRFTGLDASFEIYPSLDAAGQGNGHG